MAWPTWQQGVVTALVCIAVALVLARMAPTRARTAGGAAAREVALLAGLYSIWRLARVLPLATESGAVERARQIDRFQHFLHMPSELSLQHFVLRNGWLGRFLNAYYAILHVPALITFLVWLFVRHRDRYAHWRNGLAILTACCLVIRFVRVAPPRLVPDLGYIDLATRFGLSVYGPAGTGVSDQLAAMPSIHVGWAAVVSLGAVAASTSRWRWLVAAHVVLTALAVSATGNHWWLDGIVAVVLLIGGLRADTLVRQRVASWRARHRPAAAPPGTDVESNRSAGGTSNDTSNDTSKDSLHPASS